MRATPLLLGCLLGLVTIADATAAGTTAASGGSASSGYNCTDHAGDRSTSHETSAASGDAFNIPRGASHSTGSTSHDHASSSSTSTDDAPMHMGGGDAASGSSSHSSGLSWQSLLPGSIQ
ncbi:hypothetical protein [Dyella caseinilytica]|uniref:Secreted protein n=1 Tax=Dyella caseinilytica TaxID=1849581 RepID=A0ABX7GRD6_9GAMM|nr:hypothetical protein [Dyella caseinilytica]QRN52972.1 hypothetical protein ISN74_16220 [Dyella caseinilytica]